MRILCVGEQPEQRTVLSLALSMDPALHPTLADSGDACLAIARREPIDAILVDDTVPELDGVDTLRRLKADPVTAEIPVVLLTGAAESRAEEARAAGATACLPTPFDPLTIARAVRRILDA